MRMRFSSDPRRIHGCIRCQFHQRGGTRLLASREMSLCQKALGVKADPYPPSRPDAGGESVHALRNIGGDRTPACRNTDVCHPSCHSSPRFQRFGSMLSVCRMTETSSYFFCAIGGRSMLPLESIMAATGTRVVGSDLCLDHAGPPANCDSLRAPVITPVHAMK